MKVTEKESFPENFLWGGAISCSQAEGGFHDGGKGIDSQDLRYFDPSWSTEERKDFKNRRMYQKRFDTALKDTNDKMYPFRRGIDFYHRWKTDIDLFAEMDLKIFRTSIDWSRIYPNGDDEEPNKAGIQYYHDMFQYCHDKGIKVFVTILHYNIPVHLITKYGGWTNRKLIDFYLKYAHTLFKELGDVVDYWLPFNEINCGRFNTYNWVCLFQDFTKNDEKIIK